MALPKKEIGKCLSCSVQFSRSVVSDTLQLHGLKHTRPLCPSPILGVYSNSHRLSRWCHPTISSSVVPFSSHLLSFPASGSFQMSQLFTLGGQSIGVSASALVLPMNIQDWFPLGWTPCSPRDSQESSPTPQFKSINSLVLAFFIVQLSRSYMTTGKPIALTRQSFVGKLMSLLFNLLSRLVIVFLPRRMCLLISWLQFESWLCWCKSVLGSNLLSQNLHEIYNITEKSDHEMEKEYIISKWV